MNEDYLYEKYKEIDITFFDLLLGLTYLIVSVCAHPFSINSAKKVRSIYRFILFYPFLGYTLIIKPSRSIFDDDITVHPWNKAALVYCHIDGGLFISTRNTVFYA